MIAGYSLYDENELRYDSAKLPYSRTAVETAKIRKLLPAFANFSVKSAKEKVVALAKLCYCAKFHAI